MNDRIPVFVGPLPAPRPGFPAKSVRPAVPRRSRSVCSVCALCSPQHILLAAQTLPAEVRHIDASRAAPKVMIDEDFALALKTGDGLSDLGAVSVVSTEAAQPQAPKDVPGLENVVTEREIRVYRRLAIATLAGFVIGTERQSARSLAGVRTCSLVSLGSAIFFSIAVMYPGAKFAESVSRAASTQISAVGFLGASVLTRCVPVAPPTCDSCRHSCA